MRSRVVTVVLQVQYTIEEDKYLEESYGVKSLDDLTVNHIKVVDGDHGIIGPTELVAMADSVDYRLWSLGPCLNL